MKTFILTLSSTFPATHKRKGESTYFKEKIVNQKVSYGVLTDNESVSISDFCKEYGVGTKIHTIRANYELWAKRIEQVQNGEAILSIRYWSDKPYKSKQVEICQLGENAGVGIQEISIYPDLMGITNVWNDGDERYLEAHSVYIAELAKNDGLSLDDFKEWFKKYDLDKTMAIIHFTPFRY